jgi:NtrC-family two-component system sensor histidine kinase KinB
MSRRALLAITLSAGVAVLAILISLTVASPPGLGLLLPAVCFGALIVFTTIFGVPLAGGRGSLLPLTTVAAYLVLGPVLTGWAAFLGALVQGWIRYRWAERLEEQVELGLSRAVSVTATNAVIQTVSILVAGVLFRWAGGVVPLTQARWADLPALLLLGLTYLALNLLMAGLYIAARNPDSLKLYVGSLPNLAAYEGWPMVFTPLLALVYTQLGLGQFLFLAVALVVASLIVRDLSLARQRLERRVKELDTLQAVGQALSASLDLDTILTAIHTQVSGLMPAYNFYVALYDSGTDEVSFPLAVEDGQRVLWRSRRAGNGLTEFILRTPAPLLIRKDYAATLEALGIDKIGRLAVSWLGVPVVAGQELLGVISVQSYSPRQGYDESHQEVLVTIAAQAAVAIQNARLYARTDEALAQRVQEFDSILWTTQDGILLFDLDCRVLAANRALVDMLGLVGLELVGQNLRAVRPGDEPPLVTFMAFTLGELEGDCRALALAEQDFKRREIVIPGTPERYVERTLTPVRDRGGAITGWLLVFRDVTEERELALLRNDLTNMLIHDLRSPLTVLTSSLELMKLDLAVGNQGACDELIELAEKSGERVLRLVNDLLDISRLESGQMTVHPQPLDVAVLLDTVATRLAPLAAQAHIALETSAEAELPLLYVDPELIDRVLHNLLDNALKFTPDGGQVRLWARLDSERDLEAMLVGVSDTGPGIPPEAQARLFKKFQQVVSNRGRRMGTGLGLPFCKLAVEAHDGQIWAESAIGEGSTFVMRLPVANASLSAHP